MSTFFDQPWCIWTDIKTRCLNVAAWTLMPGFAVTLWRPRSQFTMFWVNMQWRDYPVYKNKDVNCKHLLSLYYAISALNFAQTILTIFINSMKSSGNFTFYNITILFFIFNITLSVYSLPPLSLDSFVFTSYFPVHVLMTAEAPPLLAVYWSIPGSAAPTVPGLEGVI